MSQYSLTDEQKEDLSGWSHSRTLPAGDVFKARLILALADGKSYKTIAKTLATTAPTISRWKQRFEKDGLDGLEPLHKGSKPRVATPAVQAKVLKKVQKDPKDGSTHWSCRKMAREIRISKSTVQRILTTAKLQPHRVDVSRQ